MTTPATIVVATSKPHAIDALRATWRKSKEHYQAQAFRFLSILGGLLVAQVVDDLSHGRSVFSGITSARSLLSYLVPVAYTAFRQIRPQLGASAVDSAPGATIVPEQVGLPADPTVVPVAPVTPDVTAVDPAVVPDPTVDPVTPAEQDPSVNTPTVTESEDPGALKDIPKDLPVS